VEVFVKNRLGHDVSRHLSFHFNRVQEGGAVRHLLVTVQDISQRMQLERRLASERQRAQKEFAMLLKAVDVDPAMLRQFVTRAEVQLLEVNDLLRSTSAAHGEASVLKQVDEARRRVHAIKGDAGVLGLDTIAHQAHQFENELDKVRQGAGGDLGNALLALPLPLEDLLNKVAALKGLAGLQRASGLAAAPKESINTALGKLAEQVAADCGKQVQPVIAMSGLADLEPGAADLVREIAVQLLRNAVTHGVERPDARRGAGKVEAGKLWAQLMRGESEWTLVVRDDGAGLAAAQVRRKLLELRWYTQEQLDSFDDKQIVAHIFKPGFSTAEGVSMHAGRGVGLDVVHANVQKLGARMTLSSTPGQFTEFKIKFAV
jgi:two-component system chemotaxis sensor kinase CheA